MNAMYDWLTQRGREWSYAWSRVFYFAALPMVGALSPSVYNRATRQVVEKQTYFTAWQIPPGFTFFVALFSLEGCMEEKRNNKGE